VILKGKQKKKTPVIEWATLSTPDRGSMAGRGRRPVTSRRPGVRSRNLTRELNNITTPSIYLWIGRVVLGANLRAVNVQATTRQTEQICQISWRLIYHTYHLRISN
jgi:hypothetical protein